MTTALVLGNGPSLDHLAVDYDQFEVIVATNRLISSEHIMTRSNAVYVAADTRFAPSEEWLKSLSRYQGPSWLGPDLVESLGCVTSERVRVVPDQLTCDLAQEFARSFPPLTFPHMNVVLDFALPVALNYSPTEVILSGVDFDYAFEESRRSPRYWRGYTSMSARFDHTKKSAESWSKTSHQRLQTMTTWLSEQQRAVRVRTLPQRSTHEE